MRKKLFISLAAVFLICWSFLVFRTAFAKTITIGSSSTDIIDVKGKLNLREDICITDDCKDSWNQIITTSYWNYNGGVLSTATTVQDVAVNRNINFHEGYGIAGLNSSGDPGLGSLNINSSFEFGGQKLGSVYIASPNGSDATGGDVYLSGTGTGYSGNVFVGGLDMDSLPSGNLLVYGSVGLGTTDPGDKLSVVGSIAGNESLKITNSSASNWISGRLGIGNASAGGSKLSVLGNMAIGSGYFSSAAPTNGLIVEGKAGFGTPTPLTNVEIKGVSSTTILNLLGLFNPVAGTSAQGNGAAMIIGHSNAGYYNKIATVFEQSNPSFLNPALAFYTMYNTHLAGSEVERMRISSIGNVGIGTTNPGDKLDVNGSINLSSSGKLGFGGASTNWIDFTSNYFRLLMGGSGAAPIKVGGLVVSGDYGATAPASGAYIQGNVGIGTTNPGDKLVVYNGALTKYTSTGIDGTTDSLLKFGYYNDLQTGGTGNTNRYHGIDATITAGVGSNNKMLFKLFQGGANNNAPATVMALQGNGNVGIGTTNPGYKLDVAGDINFSGSLRANGSTVPLMNYHVAGVTDIYNIATSTTNSLYTFFSSASYPANAPVASSSWVQGIQFPLASNPQYKQILASNNSDLYYGAQSGGTWQAWRKLWDSGNLSIALNVNYVPKWNSTGNGFVNSQIIDNGTNVGIGSSSPAYKLSVVGPVVMLEGNTGNTSLVLNDIANRNALIKFNSAGATQWTIGRGDSDELPASYFFIGSGSTAGANSKLVIDNSGKVGIGKTNPSANLDVNGSVAATGFCFGVDCKVSWDEIGLVGSLWSGTRNGDIWNGDSGAGEVGIGTSNPAGKLEVAGTSVNTGNSDAAIITGNSVVTGYYNSLAFRNNSTNTGARITSGNNGSYSGFLAFETSRQTAAGHTTVEAMRINGLGYVGIGTTAVNEKLTIASGNIKLYSLQNTADAYRYIGTEYNSGNGNNRAEIRFAIDGSDTRTRLSFHTANGTGTINEQMRITSNGSVGIGTTSPFSKLHIYDATSGPILTMSGLNTNYRGLTIKDTANTEKWFIGNNGSNNFVIRNGGATDYITILTDGKVGIGTNNISNAKLNIGGDISITEGSRIGGMSMGGDFGYGSININSGFDLGGVKTGNVYIGSPNGADSGGSDVYLSGTGTGPSGNVFVGGIDTDSLPSGKLLVFGTAGIGTTNPNPISTLHVEGATLTTGLGFTTDPDNIVSSWDDVVSLGGGGQWTSNSGNIYNTNYSSGNVGIGVSNPQVALHISKNQDVPLRIEATGTKAPGFDLWFGGARKGTFGVVQQSNQFVTGAAANDFVFRADGGGNFIFANSSATTQLFKIMGSGNVGIGTTNPQANLDVNTASGVLGTIRIKGGNTGNYMDSLVVAESSIDYRGRGLLLATTDSATNGAWFAGVPYTGNGFSIGNSSTHSYSSATGPYTVSNSKFFITTSGNVGIGNTNPKTKLHISQPTPDTDGLIISTNTINADGAQHYGAISFQDYETKTGNYSQIRSWSNLYHHWGSQLSFHVTTGAGPTLTEAMRINESGNVGIGTTNPSQYSKLQVDGQIQARGGVDTWETLNSGYTFWGNGGDNDSGMFSPSDGVVLFKVNNQEKMRINPSSVSIGTTSSDVAYKLIVDGTVRASQFTYDSDVRLKNNIKTIENSLDKVLSLRGVTFNWKENNQPGVGLIAQEVEEVFPELVTGTDSKGVQYGNLVAPLIEAVKEQQRIIDNLEARINILEMKNQTK